MTDQETIQYMQDCFEHMLWEHPSTFDKLSAVSRVEGMPDQQWAAVVFTILRVHDRTCDVKLIEDLD